MALLGHVSARNEPALRHGCSTPPSAPTTNARSPWPKPSSGPVLPSTHTAADHRRSAAAADWQRHPDDQGATGRRVLPAHPGPGSLRLRQHLRALPELPHRRRPSCPSWPPSAPTPPRSPPTPTPAAGAHEATRHRRLVERLDQLMNRTRHAVTDEPATGSNAPAGTCSPPAPPSPSTRSPPTPASAVPPSTGAPELRAVVEEHRRHGRDALTLTGLTVQIDQLRAGPGSRRRQGRRHEEQLRKLHRRAE